MKDAPDGEKVLLVGLTWRLDGQHSRRRLVTVTSTTTARPIGPRAGTIRIAGILILDDNQLKSLGQALRYNFLAYLLSGQGLAVDSTTLGIVQIHIIRQQSIIRDDIVVV